MFKKIKKNIKKRKIQSLLIILIGVVFSFLIIQTSDSNNEVTKKDPSSNLNNDATLDYESIAKTLENNTNNLKNGRSNVSANLTDFVADQYFKKIAKENPEGVREVNGEKLVNTPSLESFDLSNIDLNKQAEEVFKNDPFTEKDIKITDDTSKENQKKYLEKIAEIGNENSIDRTEIEMVDDWINERRTKPLKDYTDVLSKKIDDLLKVSVPSNWKAVHLELLNLTQDKITAFKAMSKPSEDAVKAIIGFSQSVKLLKKSSNLTTVLINKYNELNNNPS